MESGCCGRVDFCTAGSYSRSGNGFISGSFYTGKQVDISAGVFFQLWTGHSGGDNGEQKTREQWCRG